uniref:Uncharacterized protein n=1 Tax=viral metagenome TaxID=1070528 RepID=A0A6M3JM40_9ZZZZ
MGYKPFSIADGQLPATKGTLYVVPENTTLRITSIVLVNTGAGANTCNLYIQRDGTNSRRIMPVDNSIAASGELIIVTPISLETDDLIEGDAATVSEVDYVISGEQYISDKT